MIKKLIFCTILLFLPTRTKTDFEVSITWGPVEQQIQQNQSHIHAWKSFIKQFVAAYAIYYADQTVTHTVYETNPAIRENIILRSLLSLGLFFFANDASVDTLDLIANYDKTRRYGWAHFWGWLVATQTPKVSLLRNPVHI